MRTLRTAEHKIARAFCAPLLSAEASRDRRPVSKPDFSSTEDSHQPAQSGIAQQSPSRRVLSTAHRLRPNRGRYASAAACHRLIPLSKAAQNRRSANSAAASVPTQLRRFCASEQSGGSCRQPWLAGSRPIRTKSTRPFFTPPRKSSIAVGEVRLSMARCIA